MKLLALTFLLVGCALPCAAQSFIGGGLTTTVVTNRQYHVGPYLEGLTQLGELTAGQHKLGKASLHGVLFPDPGARFTVLYTPAYFAAEKVKPFIGIGGQWLNLPGSDEWHSTITVGAALPYGLQARATRLYLAPQGWRVGVDYLRPLRGKLALRAMADYTVNRKARDYGVASLGVAYSF